ncbi:MAG: accessory gene regulator B family protein [Ruminococcus sp.]|jgi:accessory gene regulator B|nr:accessory gene regulator B family protein [Ruminococcus sp.]
MENFFNILAQKIIHILDPDNKVTEIEYLQMHYGIQNLVYNIIVTSFILILSYLWKCFAETFMLFAIFGILRLIAGGFHFNSIFKCISATTLIMLGGGKYLSITTLNIPLCIIFCIFANIIFFFHTPRGTGKNPYSPEYSQLQKKKLNVVSTVLTVAALFVDKLRDPIILSMFIAAIFLIPESLHRFQPTE